MLESNLLRILKTDGSKEEDVSRQIERARRCFLGLFEAGAENRKLNHRHLSIRRKIMDVVAKTPAIGGYERVMALKGFSRPSAMEPVFCGPALVLLAEMEENIMVPQSPTLAMLKNPDARTVLFPRGRIRTVASGDEDAVPHASLIFHHTFYKPFLEAWYDKLRMPRLFAAVL